MLLLNYESVQQLAATNERRALRNKKVYGAANQTKKSFLILMSPAEIEKHSSDQGILDLQDWEYQALQGLRGSNGSDSVVAQNTCNPPPGVSRTCCVGSYSTGGAVESIYRHRCSASLQAGTLEALQMDARRFFRENPVTVNNNNDDETARQCDMCHIVELARSANLSIAFVGDSMQSQVVDGLSCELERRQYTVTSATTLHEQHEGDIYHRHSSTRELQIRSSLWDSSDTVSIKYHMIYRLPLDVNAGQLEAIFDADVVVLGFGLHWNYGSNEQGLYIQAMGDLLTTIRQQQRVKLLVHRETSAQHFNADGGDFVLWGNSRTLGVEEVAKCTSFATDSKSYFWREKAIRRAANHSGHAIVVAGPDMLKRRQDISTGISSELFVLPYYHYTANHPQLHPQGQVGDCTHYCSSPFLYMPLWRSLRLLLDFKFIETTET